MSSELRISGPRRPGAAREAAATAIAPLRAAIDQQSIPGALYDPIAERPGWVQCYACGHLCRIPPGRDGICRVRSNRDGVLHVPSGYVGALQLDPIEKKPFFHALPGSQALSFGMLGCDYHCSYCFTGETRVITNRGVVRLDSLLPAERITMPDGGEAGYEPGWEALTSEGTFSSIRQVFRHPYRGQMIEITPYYLPWFLCTPNHRVLATTDPEAPLSWIEAGLLKPDHYLSVPKPATIADPNPVVIESAIKRRSQERATHFLVPIRNVAAHDFHGFVYNLEIEGSHTYTANFVAVHNCQNWITSQALRDPSALAPTRRITPAELVALAEGAEARVIASTYNEPLITSEWAVEVFRAAKAAGLVTAYISNGNATPRVLDYLRPWVDLYKVDLKGFDERRYHELGGLLSTVLDTIGNLKARGFWVEVVTLVIPGWNDSDQELEGAARFLAGVDRDLPWHVTAFHQDYKMTDRADTGTETLLRAAAIGRAAGLRYVYAGNCPGRVGDWENTRCPECSNLLIERRGYVIKRNRLANGKCPDCAAAIPGVWSLSAAGAGHKSAPSA